MLVEIILPAIKKTKLTGITEKIINAKRRLRLNAEPGTFFFLSVASFMLCLIMRNKSIMLIIKWAFISKNKNTRLIPPPIRCSFFCKKRETHPLINNIKTDAVPEAQLQKVLHYRQK